MPDLVIYNFVCSALSRDQAIDVDLWTSSLAPLFSHLSHAQIQNEILRAVIDRGGSASWGTHKGRKADDVS